jgi:hypothetical protein
LMPRAPSLLPAVAARLDSAEMRLSSDVNVRNRVKTSI